MDKLSLEALSVPKAIADSLRTLSAHIVFTRTSQKGSNGYLFFGHNTILNRKVAVKYYYWGGDRTYHAEPEHLSQIDSPNVVHILDASLVGGEYAYFVTPYYKNGDLDDWLSKGIRGNREAARLVSEILNGLTHLHRRAFLHRDIKPQNIFLSDSLVALIGDFGSVKRVPEGRASVPGSGHSVLYRPPETVRDGTYSYTGDIYQTGLVLYQLLGGYLPYEETAWLNERQLRQYGAIEDEIDRSMFAGNILKNRIVRGNVIDLDSFPPWVCMSLRRTILKACNTNPEKRFSSASAFLAKLHQLIPVIHDWKIVNGIPTLIGPISYRICRQGLFDEYCVEKKKTSEWRRDNTFGVGTIRRLVTAIEKRASTN